jgi:hypothetical protein
MKNGIRIKVRKSDRQFIGTIKGSYTTEYGAEVLIVRNKRGGTNEVYEGEYTVI